MINESVFAAENEYSLEPKPSNQIVDDGLISYDSFIMNETGLWYVKKGNPDDEPVKISSAFEILGRAREPDGNRWGLYIRWLDPDNRIHEKFISASALQGEPSSLCAQLADEGLSIVRSQQRQFQQYLDGVPTERRITRIRRVGWHEVSGQPVFAIPNKHLVREGVDSLILDGVEASRFANRGTLTDWQNSVGLQSKGQILATLAISTAFAGPLLYLGDVEGGGINFFGPSSIGKSTILAAAASVWGRGGSPGFIRTWRATANGIEGVAAESSDTLLVLDELGLIDPKDLAVTVYLIANGVGKQRARLNGAAAESKSWRLMVVSSGELPIASKLSEDRYYKVKAGQLLRILDVEADFGSGFGVFSKISGFDDSAMLAKSIKYSAQQFYGTAGPEFVKCLMSRADNFEEIHTSIQKFSNRFSEVITESQIGRVAEKFGLVATAGELATSFGVVPWEQGEATEACIWAFNSWLRARGSNESYEIIAAIDQVRLFMEQHSESRFFDTEQPFQKQPFQRAGWVKGENESRRWLIPPEIWKSEICRGQNASNVAKYLAERGMLERSNDGFQQVHKIEGAPKRFYVLNPRIFAA